MVKFTVHLLPLFERDIKHSLDPDHRQDPGPEHDSET